MEKEIDYIVLVSIKNYKTDGMEVARKNRRTLFLKPKLKDQRHLETEIFKSIFGEDLGKKEFFLEAGSYGNIIEAYEKTLRTLLEKEHKVPKEYYNRLEEYKEKVHRSLFTDKEYTDDHFYDEVHEILGEYYVLQMRFPSERIPYEFNRYYLSIKKLFDNGEPLYISTAMPFEDLGF
ncbi:MULTISPECIES: hypothetical protein [Chryseobacterium]|uniref:Uncharacterized protein n=1 Tax=Chryseobacterium urinae TaxID=3058400 RepID=A0ABT8U351_9FLAO|nr:MULTISPECIES: hypothetical protein [unclassified Chryseobacterium]MBL7879593.1 hypothetical protein [Chryseobacterium gambrini]MDO3424610.1 hypothetical protein [Chryseobacterium sp. APV1]PTT75084.1 hypothetical protein DBR25_09140 [Chryseobacterium sp. HMWF001]PVV60600.1 hypothetical protein DD829_04580 [Chryseobacterium sp. HMWF035]